LQRPAGNIDTKLLLVLTIILLWVVGSVNASVNDDLEITYAPILGEYSFDMTSHGFGVLKVTFYVENEKLWAITEVSSDPGQMKPVEGRDFEFTIEDPDEGMYSIKFLKDESRKYTKCHIFNESMGMDVTGEKVT
jgi:hypothetical protein